MFMLFVFSLLINVQEILMQKMGWRWISYVDEFAALLPYMLVPFLLHGRKLPSWIYIILALPLVSIVHAITVNLLVFNEVRIVQSVLQSIINFKFFLYFVLFYAVLSFSGRSRISFNYIFFACVLVSLAGYALNVLYPEYFVFSDAPWHADRGRIAGFQFKPNDLALLLSFCVAFFVFSGSGRYSSTIISLILLLLIYVTSSRSALIIGGLLFFIYLIKIRAYFFLIGSCWVGVLLAIIFFGDVKGSFLVSETISNFQEFKNIESSRYIRAIMVYLSLVLAIDFPFGVGAGNFGSVMSADSPAYSYLGVENISFFYELSGIFDSGLASVLGEYGLLGFVLYMSLLYKVLGIAFHNDRFKIYSLMVVLFILLLVQPLFSYQVNSVNILLLIFSLREMELARVAHKEI